MAILLYLVFPHLFPNKKAEFERQRPTPRVSSVRHNGGLSQQVGIGGEGSGVSTQETVVERCVKGAGIPPEERCLKTQLPSSGHCIVSSEE